MGLLGRRCPFPSQTIDRSSNCNSPLTRNIEYNPWWHNNNHDDLRSVDIPEEQTKSHRCGWFSIIHLRLRLCTVIVRLRRVHRACHNDVVGHLADEEWCPRSTSWWIHKKRANTDMLRAPVRGGHDASYPRAEKMGEIAYGLRSPKELDIYFLPCGYKIDETWYTSFDHGQDHRTQEIRIEEKGGVDVTSKGALISKGGIILMEFYIIFFTYTVNNIQYRETPTKDTEEV